MAERELLEVARALRDELYHGRALTREMRNRTNTLARSFDDACGRVDGLIVELESLDHHNPMEGSGDRQDRNGKTVSTAG